MAIGLSSLISGGSGIVSGIISNIAGGIKAGVAHKQAKKAAASLGIENFRQQQFLQQLQEKRRALESGTAYQAQQEAIKQQGALAGENVLKLSGGAVGSAISALNRLNRSTGRNLNELYGNMSMEGLQMQNLIGQTVQSMANREYSIKAMAAGQALAESKQTSKDVMANAMGSLTSLASGIDWGGLGKKTVGYQGAVDQFGAGGSNPNALQNVTTNTNAFTNSLFSVPETRTPYNGVLAPQTGSLPVNTQGLSQIPSISTPEDLNSNYTRFKI